MREMITTERLILRPIKMADAEAVSLLGGEKDVARMTGSLPQPFPKMSAEFWIMATQEKMRKGQAHPYVISRSGGDLMGIVDIFKRETDGPSELGYWLGKPFWGKGYMREACEAVIKEFKTRSNDRYLTAGVFADNPRSLKLLLGLGFKSTESYRNWFSMARMEKARGVELTLDLRDQRRAIPLRQSQKMVIRA